MSGCCLNPLYQSRSPAVARAQSTFAKFSMRSFISSEVVVLSDCCHMTFPSGSLSMTTFAHGATVKCGSGFILRCASESESRLGE